MAEENKIIPSTNVQEIIKKGKEVYETLKDKLEPEHNGKYVIIEIDSGDFFIGETKHEAITKAKAKYPDKILFIKKIGQIEKISRHIATYSNLKYA